MCACVGVCLYVCLSSVHACGSGLYEIEENHVQVSTSRPNAWVATQLVDAEQFLLLLARDIYRWVDRLERPIVAHSGR